MPWKLIRGLWVLRYAGTNQDKRFEVITDIAFWYATRNGIKVVFIKVVKQGSWRFPQSCRFVNQAELVTEFKYDAILRFASHCNKFVIVTTTNIKHFLFILRIFSWNASWNSLWSCWGCLQTTPKIMPFLSGWMSSIHRFSHAGTKIFRSSLMWNYWM